MPDDPVAMHGNEGEFGVIIAIITESIHQACFAILPECLQIDLKNAGDIFRAFRPDIKGIHPVYFGVWVDKERVWGSRFKKL
jgi:hypothetical protein